MAKLTPGGIQFTGSLQNISVYNRIDCKDPIVRTKGGASKEKIYTLPSFAPTRRQNSEWDGSSKGASSIRKVLLPLKHICDHNMISALKPLVMQIQKKDTSHEPGKRHVQFSKAAPILAGFSLNNRNPLESVLKAPVNYTLNKESLRATVQIPAVLPRLNFFPIGTFPVYKWTGILGVVPDIILSKSKGFIPVETPPPSCVIESTWLTVKEEVNAFRMDFSLPELALKGSYALLLVLGISFGLIRSTDKIEIIKYAGAAKVIGVE